MTCYQQGIFQSSRRLNGIFQWQNGIMTTTITMDRAGRVVLPKAVRDELNLSAGDSLELSSDSDGLTLRPARASGRMIRKGGFWVFRSEGKPITLEESNRWLQEIREERERKHLGLAE